MQPLGLLPISVKLGAQHLNEEFHFYPTVSETLLSWKAAKKPYILPPQYPKPIHPQDPSVVAANKPHPTDAFMMNTQQYLIRRSH